QSTAEQDMELIRTKRATTTAGAVANTGQPKSKYRKRSATTPPGKCHSCNIRETPEWRRGPDGPRTLCNACGLHYAKLTRKQNKMNPGPNGEPPPPIDMDMLRASTRAAEAEKTSGRPRDDNSPSGPPTHHQGSFQVITMAPQVHNEPTPATSPTASEHQQPVTTQSSSSTSTSILNIPPPPWSTSPPVSGRVYQPTEQSQQSFVRSSVPTNSPR
ncbi:GATA-domain-containing protein, partial [Marasmius fiardii PR-910]